MTYAKRRSSSPVVIGLWLVATSALVSVLIVPCWRSATAAGPTIEVTPTAATVGSTITVHGAGFASNLNLLLKWTSQNASWLVAKNPPQVTGVKATPTEKLLGSIQSDASGSFSAQLVVPPDYGGTHSIQAFLANGTSFPPAAPFTMEPHFQLSRTSGPAGTPIRVDATGLGLSIYSTSYHLNWDNSYVGYMTALSTGGSTNFTFYASGLPGPHYIDIYEGYPGPGYLNPQQSPSAIQSPMEFPPEIPFHATFTITPQQVGLQSSQSATAFARIEGNVGFLALLVVLGVGALFVSRQEPETREAVSRALAALGIIILVAVAGVGLYVASGRQGAGSTTSVIQTSGPNVTFAPEATVIRPHIAVAQNAAVTGPRIFVSPDVASVGDNITVGGAGFAPNSQLPLVWTTRQGSNIQGYNLVNKPLRNITAGADGSFSFTMKVPPDLGGFHYIAAGNLTRNSNGTLFLQRSATLSTTQGPEGTQIRVIIHGVGWDFDSNIVAVDYDNSYIGYACGFNSGGNVTVTLSASGSPGIHTIDVYPSVWWGSSNFGSQLAVEYRYPVLTPQDHPELMPAFHFTFLITPGSAQSE